MLVQHLFGRDISEGNLSSTDLGYYQNLSSNVVTGIITVDDSETATATVTIVAGGKTFVLPTLDLSDPANQVPFVLPVVDASLFNVMVSIDVTGSVGGYTLTIMLT